MSQSSNEAGRYMPSGLQNLLLIKTVSWSLTVPVPTTIAAYDAFILYPAHRYDIKGKRILKQEKKYYAVDLGMRRIQLNYAWVEECDW